MKKIGKYMKFRYHSISIGYPRFFHFPLLVRAKRSPKNGHVMHDGLIRKMLKGSNLQSQTLY